MQEVQSNGMPAVGGPLLADLKSLLQRWIADGALQASATAQPPEASATPAPVGGTTGGNPAAPTFENVQARILNVYCIQCHSGARASGGYDLSSFAGVMTGGRVVAGNAARSVLYSEVQSNSMPASGAPVTAELKTLLQTWINQGAVGPAGSAVVTVPPATGGAGGEVEDD